MMRILAYLPMRRGTSDSEIDGITPNELGQLAGWPLPGYISRGMSFGLLRPLSMLPRVWSSTSPLGGIPPGSIS